MSTVAEILSHALRLSPADRATIAESLLDSLPKAPQLYTTEGELAEELNRRIEAVQSGDMPTYDAADSIRRAREALAKVRQ